MSSDPISRRPPASLRFVCQGCGTPLILPDACAAVSGPCPKCAAWIDAGQFTKPEPYVKTPNVILGSGSPKRHRANDMISGRGSVRADGFLDHEYNERRELFGTLRVIAVALAVMAVILFVTLYLRQWMSA